MEVENLILGDLNTNCYIVKKDKCALIIDPACDSKLIVSKCKGLDVKGILVTHHHYDHIGALGELEEFYDLKHNDFNNEFFNYEVLKTPGHTDDSISFYFKREKILFSGDFLFFGTIGRMDFFNSNPEDMKKSLETISKLPDDILVYPGHSLQTTLGREKKRFDFYLESFFWILMVIIDWFHKFNIV